MFRVRAPPALKKRHKTAFNSFSPFQGVPPSYGQNMPDGLFIFFAALTLGAASLLVLSRNAVTSAMGMILALVGVAADFFLLDAYFLGVLQVLVYAGAVMVLFLFVILSLIHI